MFTIVSWTLQNNWSAVYRMESTEPYRITYFDVTLVY